MKGGLRIIKLGGIVLKDRSREELDFMRGEGAGKKIRGRDFLFKNLENKYQLNYCYRLYNCILFQRK